jgi:hypothetical protein
MLTDTERTAALKIVVAATDPNDYAATDDRLCAQYPAIETEDLASLWQEAGNRAKAEAEELRRFARLRAKTANSPTDNLRVVDPEFFRMMEGRSVSIGDIPNWLSLGYTEDGRTRGDFETEVDFEDEMLRIGTKHATIAQVDEHLAFEGNKARETYLHILALATIRDGMLKRANGDTSAKFWELLNGHFAAQKDRTSG